MNPTNPLRRPARRPAIDPGDWTGQLVRELLAVIYGCHQTRKGSSEAWVPDWAAVAHRRRISQRTAQRWTTPGAPPTIPTHQLTAIISPRRPTARQLHTEQLQAARIEQIAARARLGRSRGRLPADYAHTGWLEPHRLLITEDNHQPLRRALIVRDNPTLIHRATRRAHIIDLVLTDTRWTAQRHQLTLLTTLTPWRITPPTTHHTGTWLASAPLPDLPLTARLNP